MRKIHSPKSNLPRTSFGLENGETQEKHVVCDLEQVTVWRWRQIVGEASTPMVGKRGDAVGNRRCPGTRCGLARVNYVDPISYPARFTHLLCSKGSPHPTHLTTPRWTSTWVKQFSIMIWAPNLPPFCIDTQRGFARRKYSLNFLGYNYHVIWGAWCFVHSRLHLRVVHCFGKITSLREALWVTSKTCPSWSAFVIVFMVNLFIDNLAASSNFPVQSCPSICILNYISLYYKYFLFISPLH